MHKNIRHYSNHHSEAIKRYSQRNQERGPVSATYVR